MASNPRPSSETRRCAWTNQEADNLREVVLTVPDRLGTNPEPKTFYVLPEYEQRLRRHIGRLQRFGATFVISMTVLTAATLVAALLRRPGLVGVIIVLVGALFIALPFATPETVKSLGFGSTVLLVRVLGVIIVLIGAYLAAMH